MAVSFRAFLEDEEDTPFHNPFIGSLVTAYARRELNAILQQLGPRLLYW